MRALLALPRGLPCRARFVGARCLAAEAPPASVSPPPPASVSPLAAEAPPASVSPAPPAQSATAEAPPAAAAASPPAAAASPPPPSSSAASAATGLRCGGFFFAVDPNIGLWNDRVNPNWRLTFTDEQSKEKQRVPYAFAIQNRGPHAELGVRFQFGFVQCEGLFAAIPERFNVDSGWELTFPLPFSGVRFCHNVIGAEGANGSHTNATVYCVDLALGFSAGFQQVVSGVGVKGAKGEATWRGDVAAVAFILAVLGGAYNLMKLPSTWLELREIWSSLDDDDDDPASQTFEALDVDGDGYITLEDLHNFAREAGLGNEFDADALFEKLDVSRSGRVSFEEFQVNLQALLASVQGGGGGMYGGMSQPNPGMQGMPFGNGQISRDLQLQPFGGAFASGLAPGLAQFPGRRAGQQYT